MKTTVQTRFCSKGKRWRCGGSEALDPGGKLPSTSNRKRDERARLRGPAFVKSCPLLRHKTHTIQPFKMQIKSIVTGLALFAGAVSALDKPLNIQKDVEKNCPKEEQTKVGK